ncbi:hypothetical protein O6H91_19G070100 [Diphasiastrum complanatum]|uniref:Uncharacterized protein n=1 Tax=Diphasiastrum complanatum TaxID=34168 RepID=A0ACC2AWE3_DIPCM|nr:hypothetical protein O6H91_19G070100 [Diphasiastrum complanatum]
MTLISGHLLALPLSAAPHLRICWLLVAAAIAPSSCLLAAHHSLSLRVGSNVPLHPCDSTSRFLTFYPAPLPHQRPVSFSNLPHLLSARYRSLSFQCLSS